MKIKAMNLSTGKMLGNQHGGDTVTTADIGKTATRSKFFSERGYLRQPARYQIGFVDRLEKARGATEIAGMMLAPGQAFACFEGGTHFGLVYHQ